MLKTGVLIGAGIAAAGLVFFAMTPGDAQMEGQSMAPPDMSGITEGAAIVEVSVPETFEGRAVLGETAFNAVCAQCHGANAAGQNGVAPPLVHQLYEPGHHGEAAFLSAVRNGVQSHHWNFGNMPAIEGLTDGDVGNIVAYIRTLQSANGID